MIKFVEHRTKRTRVRRNESLICIWKPGTKNYYGEHQNKRDKIEE
jgi:hypothetical protein